MVVWCLVGMHAFVALLPPESPGSALTFLPHFGATHFSPKCCPIYLCEVHCHDFPNSINLSRLVRCVLSNLDRSCTIPSKFVNLGKFCMILFWISQWNTIASCSALDCTPFHGHTAKLPCVWGFAPLCMRAMATDTFVRSPTCHNPSAPLWG